MASSDDREAQRKASDIKNAADRLIGAANSKGYESIGKDIAACLMPNAPTETQSLIAQRINAIFADHFADEVKAGGRRNINASRPQDHSFGIAYKIYATPFKPTGLGLQMGALTANDRKLLMEKVFAHDLRGAKREIDEMAAFLAKEENAEKFPKSKTALEVNWKTQIDKLAYLCADALKDKTLTGPTKFSAIVEYAQAVDADCAQTALEEALTAPAVAEVAPPAPVKTAPVVENVEPVAPQPPANEFENRDFTKVAAAGLLLAEWKLDKDHIKIIQAYDTIVKNGPSNKIGAATNSIKSIIRAIDTISESNGSDQKAQYANLRKDVAELKGQLAQIAPAFLFVTEKDNSEQLPERRIFMRWQSLVDELDTLLPAIPEQTAQATFSTDDGAIIKTKREWNKDLRKKSGEATAKKALIEERIKQAAEIPKPSVAEVTQRISPQQQAAADAAKAASEALTALHQFITTPQKGDELTPLQRIVAENFRIANPKTKNNPEDLSKTITASINKQLEALTTIDATDAKQLQAALATIKAVEKFTDTHTKQFVSESANQNPHLDKMVNNFDTITNLSAAATAACEAAQKFISKKR